MNPSDFTVTKDGINFLFSYEDDDDEGLGDEEQLTDLLEQHGFYKWKNFEYEFESDGRCPAKILKELGFNVEES